MFGESAKQSQFHCGRLDPTHIVNKNQMNVLYRTNDSTNPVVLACITFLNIDLFYFPIFYVV